MKSLFIATALWCSASFAADSGTPSGPPQGPPPGFQAAIQACETSSLNKDGVTLPEMKPGVRPDFSAAQKTLIEACTEAGIMPKPPRHHHDQDHASN